MSYIKHLFIALLIVLGTAGITFSNTSANKPAAETRQALNTEVYVYIDGILYHIIYDDKGNIIFTEEME